jgi:hypothetical protein
MALWWLCHATATILASGPKIPTGTSMVEMGFGHCPVQWLDLTKKLGGGSLNMWKDHGDLQQCDASMMPPVAEYHSRNKCSESYDANHYCSHNYTNRNLSCSQGWSAWQKQDWEGQMGPLWCRDCTYNAIWQAVILCSIAIFMAVALRSVVGTMQCCCRHLVLPIWVKFWYFGRKNARISPLLVYPN